LEASFQVVGFLEKGSGVNVAVGRFRPEGFWNVIIFVVVKIDDGKYE
jgi:hypothetical protein